MVSFTARLKNNVITNHLVNWLSPMKERVTVVTGERGAFVADTIGGDLTFFENGTVQNTEWESVDGVPRRLRGRRCSATRSPSASRCGSSTRRSATPILGRGGNIVTMREGLANVRVAEAVLTSANQSRTVNVSE